MATKEVAMKRGIITKDGILRLFFLLIVFSVYTNTNTNSTAPSISASSSTASRVDCGSIAPVHITPERQLQKATTTTATTITISDGHHQQAAAASAAVATPSNPAAKRTKARILVGYFAHGVSGQGRTFKRRLKMGTYFNLVDDKRVCTLNSLLYGKRVRGEKKWQPVTNGNDCQFIYTFVSGFTAEEESANNPNATTQLPTELLDDNVPIDNVDAYRARVASHPGDADMTFLNIRENMNEGKSQTWFKYAAQIMDRLDIDYAIKTDTDCLIVMDHFFSFADAYLPPHGNLIYAGRLSDKAFWDGSRQFHTVDGPSTVNALRRRAMVELYMAGELYILSNDLAHWVSSSSSAAAGAGAAPFANQSWYEQIEDHDVGMRVFDHPRPLRVVRVSPNQQFWVHPVKDHQTWKLFMNRESRRKSGVDYIIEGGKNGTEVTELSKHFQHLLRITTNNDEPSSKI